MYGFVDPKIPFAIKGDEYRIKQIISNLLSNAIKFTDNNGKIFFSVCFNDVLKKLVITVADNGIGMDKQDLNKLFERFQQSETNDAELKNAGSGLGMSIVYNLVKLMKGNIRVKSKKSVGTVIKVFLPVKTYRGIPPSLSKKDIKNNYYLVKDLKNTSNEFLNKEIIRFFKKSGQTVNFVSLNELESVLKKGNIILISEFTDELLNSSYFDNKRNCNFVFIKNGYETYDNLPEHIKIVAYPIIGGDDFIQKILNEKKPSNNSFVKSTTNYSVLVIDDNPINLKIMRELLKSLNMTPFLAENKDEAMEILTKNKIDIIFMDEIMPTINGSELIKMIKSSPRHNKIKIFGLTGDTKEETIRKLLEAGAEEVLTKPISLEKLKSIFNNL